jgi:dynein heavy chain
MQEEWKPLNFGCITVEGKDSYILNGEDIELIQTVLDDHIIKTQTMKGSPFAKFMYDQIVQWEKMLMQTQDNLDLWLKV